MFEYAISKGPGTLIDYGVRTAASMNHHANTRESIEFGANGDIWANLESGSQILFCPASPDCETGE
jgi:hypothetical protein